VHVPLTDPADAQKGPQRSVCDKTNFPPLNPPLPAPHTLRRSARVQERKEQQNPPTVNAIFQTPTPTPTLTLTHDEEQEKKKKTRDKGREEEREGQKVLPTSSTGQHRLCSLDSTKLLSGQV
jgi:hypothetical protein